MLLFAMVYMFAYLTTALFYVANTITISCFSVCSVLQQELKAKDVIAHMQSVNKRLNHELHPVTFQYRKKYETHIALTIRNKLQ